MKYLLLLVIVFTAACTNPTAPDTTPDRRCFEMVVDRVVLSDDGHLQTTYYKPDPVPVACH